MSDIKKLEDAELSKVSGGDNNNSNPFDGLAVGDIYQSNTDPNKYAKIAFINNNNNGDIDYFRGTRQGDYIAQYYPTGIDTPGKFKRDFNTNVKITLEWRVGLIN